MTKHIETDICCFCLGKGYDRKKEKCLGCDGTGKRVRLTKEFREDLK